MNMNGRLVRIFGNAGAIGDGYLIAADLVLTALPVNASSPLTSDGLEVAPTGPADDRYTGRVVWSDPDTAIALLRIEDSHWSAARLPPPRWGIFTGGIDWTAATVVGTRELAVRVNPLNGRVPRRWDLATSAEPGELASARTGSALFVGDLLCGVVIREGGGAALPGNAGALGDGGGPGLSLSAVALSSAIENAEFRGVVEAATGQRPRPVPIELADILQVWQTSTPPHTPADLLDPARDAWPFLGRETILRQLNRWCTNGVSFGAQLIDGPAGAGKTRLVRQLAASVQDSGWAVGELTAGRPAERSLRHLERIDRPLLLIADDAAGDPQSVQAVAEYLSQHPGRQPVRVIVLARDALWWSDWHQRLGDSGLAFDAAAVHLADDWYDVEAARAVAQGIAQEMGIAGPLDESRLNPLAGRAASAVRHGALAILAGADGEPTSEDGIIARAVHDWKALAGLPPSYDPAWLTTIAISMIHTPANRTAAMSLLADLPSLAGPSAADLRGTLADRLHQLYPPRDPARGYWGRPLTGQLGERFLGTYPDPAPLLAALTGLEARAAEDALERLARAAAQSASLAAALRDSIRQHLETLGPPAIRAAARASAPEPLLEAVGLAVEAGRLPQRVGQRLVQAVPAPAGRLARIAVLLREELIRQLQIEFSGPSHSGGPELGRQLTSLSRELSEVGSPAEALNVSAEAVAVLRQVQQTAPLIATGVDLLDALRCQADQHLALGENEQARVVAAEEVDVARDFVHARPGNTPDSSRLADALVHLAHLLPTDQPERVIAMLEEAAGIYEAMGEASWSVPFARTVRDLSGRLAAADLHSRAAAATSQYVAVCERLAQDRPVRGVPLLATAFEILAVRLRRAGELPAAVQAAERSVSLYRRLARTLPNDQLPELSRALCLYSDLLAVVDRPDDALEAARDGVARLRRHTSTGYLSSLVAALETLMKRWDERGDNDRAGDVAVELVGLHRHPVDDADPRRAMGLATALIGVLLRRGAGGDLDQAQRAGEDAVRILVKQPGGEDDTGYNAAMAAAHNNLAIVLGERGGAEQLREAVRHAKAAVDLLKGSAEWLDTEEYACALGTLALRQAAVGEQAASLEAFTTAALVRRGRSDEFAGREGARHACTLIGLAEVQAVTGDFVAAARTVRECLDGIHGVRQKRPDLLRAEAAAAALLLTQLPANAVAPAESMSAAAQAVDRYRELREAGSDHYEEPLAEALLTMAGMLDGGGQLEESIRLCTEAVVLYSSIARSGYPYSLMAHVEALRLLAIRYDSAAAQAPAEGRATYRQFALQAARQALAASAQIHDETAQRAQGAPSAQLVSSLLANGPDDYWPEALSYANKAVLWYEGLATAQPDIYLANLAHALMDRSKVQARLRNDQGLDDAAKAEQYFRAVSEHRPEYRHQHAEALMNLAYHVPITDMAMRRQLYRKIVDIYEALHAEALPGDMPATYRMALRSALTVLIKALQEGGRHYRSEVREREDRLQALDEASREP